MDADILNLALEWLYPSDLAKCCQVCKDWNGGITQQTWKKAAANRKPAAVQALERVTKNRVDGKTIALVLAGQATDEFDYELPTPTLKKEDVFIMIELEAMGTHGAWCMKLSELLELDLREETPKFGYRPGQQGQTVIDPGDNRADYVLEQMSMTLSFWRMDTGQGVRVESVKRFGDSNFKTNVKPMGNGSAGVVAHELCFWKEINCIRLLVDVHLDPVICSWDTFEFCSEAEYYSHYVSRLKLEIRGHLSIMCGDGSELEFEDGDWMNLTQRELLVMLEGLDWK